MTEIEWAEPPGPIYSRGTAAIQATVEALKQRPGQWAIILRNTHAARGDRYKKMGCEVTTRSAGKPKGKCDIYARWPEPKEENE